MSIRQSDNLYYLEGQYKRMESPLWWQLVGLMYTSTGYGSKIPTRYKLALDGREYRIYCRVYSNSGTCYIVSRGRQIIINGYNFINE